MMKIILLTGGSGLLGKHFREAWKGSYEVRNLSRRPKEVDEFYWDPAKKELDASALEGIDIIIHLAGAGIADKPWSEKRKKLIIDSRVESAAFLLEECKKKDIRLEAFISASGIGYYGSLTQERAFTEADPPGNDFVAEVCIKWEEAAFSFNEIADRVSCIRTGLVLSSAGGMLGRLEPFFKYNLGSPIASGKQYMPWIHINDMERIYALAIEENIGRIVNAVAAQKINNKEFSKILAKSMKKKIILPNVPAFALKILYGEMAILLTEGSPVEPKVLEELGFKFTYSELTEALAHL